jgi:hypothetical protein
MVHLDVNMINTQQFKCLFMWDTFFLNLVGNPHAPQVMTNSLTQNVPSQCVHGWMPS